MTIGKPLWECYKCGYINKKGRKKCLKCGTARAVPLVKPLITHYCEECGTGFEVPQGSQRKYCNEHLVARVTAGKKKEGK